MNKDLHNKPVRGRLAPSPTGYLHLGNAWAFLAAWLGVRSAGGRLILRLEDIDPQRAKPEFALALQEDLRWLGLDWDEGPYTQNARLDIYAAALAKLQAQNLVYPCFCSRKELRELAGAPQADSVHVRPEGGVFHPDGYAQAAGSHVRGAGARVPTEGVNVQSRGGVFSAGNSALSGGVAFEGAYSGVCHNLSRQEREAKLRSGQPFAWRVNFTQHLRPEFLSFEDLVLGQVCFTSAEAGGDFALRRSDGVFAYQLAVVLDDIEQGITQVVRGNDILSSTPRQLFLYSLLGGVRPAYAHLPLLLDHEGERLAKRHASISLRGLRSAGVTPAAVIGWLAQWSGLRAELAPCRARDLLEGFAFSAVKHDPGRLPVDITEQLLHLS